MSLAKHVKTIHGDQNGGPVRADEITPEREPQLQVKRKGKKPEGLSSAGVTGMALGDLGSAEVIPISEINIDEGYQRSLRHDFVNEIGSDYDIVKAGASLVNERKDGKLYLVDGQHRMMGALQAGETEIFAHVVHGYTQAEEAELRLARNNRKPDSMFEKFRSRLVMGDKKAEHMLAIAEEFNTTINIQAESQFGINAIGAVEALYDAGEGGGVWLRRTLKLLSEAYGEDAGPKVFSANMLKAAAWFAAQHFQAGEASYKEFVQRLKDMGPDDIRRKAVSHAAVMGGSLWINYYRAMVEIWNFRRGEKQKIKARTVGSISTLGRYGKHGQGRSSNWGGDTSFK